MTGSLVLITGATGYIGVQILVAALKAGYRVRCATRSESGIKKVQATRSFKELSPSEDQLSWVFVPDITAPGAYDEAVKGVEYIIHAASPVPNAADPSQVGKSDDELYVKPAVAGSLSILESAAAHAKDTLKRIVMTSSIAAVVPLEYFAGFGDVSKLPLPSTTRCANLVEPYPEALGPFAGYIASKIAQLNASEDWLKERSPSFDVVNIVPSWVWGEDETATTSKQLAGGSNGILLNPLQGYVMPGVNGACVSVKDIAAAHVGSLKPHVAGGSTFFLGHLETFEDAHAIARKHFPEAYEKGIFRDDKPQPTSTLMVETPDTEKEFGFKYTPFEEIIKAAVGQYVDLVTKEQAAAAAS